MEVKNTFIDVPATPMGGIRASLASAPAQYAAGFSMKESLAQAAGSGASPAPAVLSESSLVKLNMSRPRRAKPMELGFMSTQSMMSVAESPTAGQMQLGEPLYGLMAKKATVLSGGLNSVPPTPVGLMDWGSTPTGTPYAGSTMLPMPVYAPAVTMTTVASTSPTTMAAPAAAARWADSLPTPKGAPVVAPKQTFSLSGMIQSPTAEAKAFGLNQMFAGPVVQSVSVMMPQAPPSAPPMMAPTLTGSMILGPPVNAPNFQAPPMMASFSAAAPQFSAMVQPGINPGNIQGSAAALLGLLGAPAAASQVAVGTLKTAGPTLVKPASPVSVQVSPTFPYAHQGQGTTVTYAQPVQPSTMNFPTQFIPPPPMCSPKGLGSPILFSAPAPAPTSSVSDVQVLLDMALASGNQKAVEALMRQAQQSGISASAFNAMKTSAAPQ